MVNDDLVYSMRLSSLPNRIRQLLSDSLNSEKIIPCDGPDIVPRDWRGLAFHASLPACFEATIRQQYADKTARVLEIWQQKEHTATVGQLIQYLERIDRYDVAEDVYNELVKNPYQSSGNNQYLNCEPVTELITEDDLPGSPKIYDAMILYADEDIDFVEKMMQRMRDAGYECCTKDQLQAGHSTQYAPMSRLISSRCRRVVLVLSPAFLHSPAMRFYTNYATADGIEKQQLKILPIMYRHCELPPGTACGILSYYHMLFYESDRPPLYDFWKKLFHSLAATRMAAVHSQDRNILSEQQTTPYKLNGKVRPALTVRDNSDSQLFLPPPDVSRSMPRLDALDVPKKGTANNHSISNGSLNDDSQKKKKKNYLSKLFSTLKRKKNKEIVMVAD